MNSTEILDRVKLFLNAKSDIELSKKLGKFPNYIYQLKKRNNIDIDVLIGACPDADFNWLLTGDTDKKRSVAELDAKGNRAEVTLKMVIDRANETYIQTESVAQSAVAKAERIKEETDSAYQAMLAGAAGESGTMSQLNQESLAFEVDALKKELNEKKAELEERMLQLVETNDKMFKLQQLLAEYQLKGKM